MDKICQAVFDICILHGLGPQILYKLVTQGQARVGQMGKWLWRRTTTGSRSFHRMEWNKCIQWFPMYGFRKVWTPVVPEFSQVLDPWASQYGANRQTTMTLHNDRWRQFHETANGVNLSSGFRDIHSVKSGLQWYQIWKVFVPRASSYRVHGRSTMTFHNFGVDNSG